MKLSKLNQFGVLHWAMVVPVVVVIAVAGIGVKVIQSGHAYTCVGQLQYGRGANQVYYPGHLCLQISRSGGGVYRAVFQSDGNFVIYENSTAIWQTHTYGKGATNLDLQYDGNVVIYRGGTPLWASNGFNQYPSGTNASDTTDTLLINSGNGHVSVLENNYKIFNLLIWRSY